MLRVLHFYWILTQQVTVDQGHQIPEHTEEKPGAGECGREQEELVTPLHVQEGGPEVPHVEGAPATDVLDAHVAPAIFGQHTPPPPQVPTPSRLAAAQ